MSETLFIASTDKVGKYRELISQLDLLLQGENDCVANAANTAAALMEVFTPLWVGFYFVRTDELVLGPFQGPIACSRIAYGRGVCGTAWKDEKTIIVDDVEKFPGHIACSSASKSEIVVPVRNDGRIVGVLDIDRTEYASFNQDDAHFLEEVVAVFVKHSHFNC